MSARPRPSLPTATLLLAAFLLAASCGPTPGSYDVASVPDLSAVGADAYMAWFEEHAVTDGTRRFVAAHRPALEAAVRTGRELSEDRAGVEVMTRRDRRFPDRPGLKEPRKVEEKIYRMIRESEGQWAAKRRGEPVTPLLPAGVTPAEARARIFAADPREPYALRDIAGLRVVAPDIATVRAVEARVRRHFGAQTLRFKDYIDEDYRGDGYRSVHFVVRVEERPVEIQVRTRRQHRWASWEHSLVYKGRFKGDAEVLEYSRAVAQRLHEQDEERCEPPCTLPECPAKLQAVKRCFPERP